MLQCVSAGSAVLGVAIAKYFGGDITLTYLLATAGLFYGVALIWKLTALAVQS